MSALYDPKHVEIDGKKYSVKSLDKEAARCWATFLLDFDGIDPHTVYRFTSKRLMKTWLKEHGLTSWYEDISKGLNRSRRALDEMEQREIKRIQIQEVTRMTTRFQKALKESDVKSSDVRNLNRVIENYDQMRGTLLSSVVLYEHCGFQGRNVYLASGWNFPRFSWFSFDNIASSLINRFGTLTLFPDEFFTGAPDDIAPLFLSNRFSTRYISCLAGSPFFYNDIASSARVGF